MNKSSFGKFHVSSIPDDVKRLEDTKMFGVMLRFFLRQKKRNEKKEGKEFHFEPKDIIWSTELSREMEEYLLDIFALDILSMDKDTYIKFKGLKDDFKKRYNYKMRSSTELYDDIYRIIFLPIGLSKSDVKTAMLQFNTAYHMMKDVFHNKKRESKDDEGELIRYFEHLKETMKIVLYELPNPNMDKVLIALLHDVREDIPDIRYETLVVLFGKSIADGVEELSKKDWRDYFTEEEERDFEKLSENSDLYKEMKDIAKERRTVDYFGHLEELDDDDLDVKFADRIHNLRTLDQCDLDKIVRKIIETEDYFMDIAYRKKQESIERGEILEDGRNYAYDLMKKEIDRLKSDFHIYMFYIKEVEKNKRKKMENKS